MNDQPLNIVVPMAGRGSRFSEWPGSLPKPLIEIHDIPMIRLVIENLRPSFPHSFVFICLREHCDSYQLDESLRQWAPGCSVIEIDTVTEGAACTVLTARSLINNNRPLMIANCDQWIEYDINDYLSHAMQPGLHGLIMTMRSEDPKWSFARTDESGAVTMVAEKQVISNEATVGIYNFSSGSLFVNAAERMIQKDLRVKGEFYVAPVYNELIADACRIEIHNVGDVENSMYGLGTPEDLRLFISKPLSMSITRRLITEARDPI